MLREGNRLMQTMNKFMFNTSTDQSLILPDGSIFRADILVAKQDVNRNTVSHEDFLKMNIHDYAVMFTKSCLTKEPKQITQVLSVKDIGTVFDSEGNEVYYVKGNILIDPNLRIKPTATSISRTFKEYGISLPKIMNTKGLTSSGFCSQLTVPQWNLLKSIYLQEPKGWK